MKINLIAALSKNRVIGVQNALPWHISEDLKRFRALTMGHAVLMGRKTFESIGRPLSGRQNFVLTRKPGALGSYPGVFVEQDFDGALKKASISHQNLFIIGGSEIYQMSLPKVDRMYLTLIHSEFQGDAYFPAWEPTEFKEISRDDRTEYSWATYDRIFNL